ncbi:MAG: phosphoribosylanthranilate isomerase [Gemmatimonadota bacterium]|jgi:phosphoribosylanthranilate isomerase|nr:phosphoribosylanthranilate isomerase [Gemmatimonadota bacterium]
MTVMKFCGLTRSVDARVAEEAGAGYGGVILAPGGLRTVDPGTVTEIFSASALRRVGVFVNEPPARVAALAREIPLNVVQLHGEESPAEVAALRRELGRHGIAVWKAIRPRSGKEFLTESNRYAGSVDGLVMDGWSPRAHGGTGATFPWHEVAAHRATLPADLHIIVAGGLTPANVAEVISILHPDVVDVSSGVELSPGVKDPEKIRAFALAVAEKTSGRTL